MQIPLGGKFWTFFFFFFTFESVKVKGEVAM